MTPREQLLGFVTKNGFGPALDALLAETRADENEACAKIFCVMCQDYDEYLKNPIPGWEVSARGEEGHETCSYEAEKIRERMAREPEVRA